MSLSAPAQQIRLCEGKLSRVKDAKSSFTTEKRLLRNRTKRAEEEKKEEEFEERVAKLMTELQWAKTEGNRMELMGRGGAARGTGEGKTNQDYLSAAR